MIAEDAYSMTLAVLDGMKGSNKELFENFDYTDCAVFGGDQSDVTGIHASIVLNLIIPIFFCLSSLHNQIVN